MHIITCFFSYIAIVEDYAMKFISNVFMMTGIILIIPLLFYVLFHGTRSGNLPNIEKVNSGYTIERNGKDYDLDRYVTQVLPTQIGDDVEFEAVKAQAIIIRTNILRQMGDRKKIDAKKLEESYASSETLKKQMGKKEYQRKKQIWEKAVLQTRGMAMMSQKDYIMPLFHAVSIGTTISAKELYGKEISYLQSADSSSDVESKDYMHVEEWKYEDARTLIEKKRGTKVPSEEELQKKIAVTSKTTSGYVKKIKVGSETFTGEEWAEIFSLPSTNFYVEDYEGKMRIITLGKGHGLGLSQYGANEMAKDGADAQTILNHYYQKIEIKKVYE